MASGPSFDPSATESALRDLPELELLGLMRRSSNYTFLARLRSEADSEQSLLAIYKPADGERPLWDFPSRTLYQREVAAYLLSRRLGWPQIPPTVVRATAPHGVGSLQLFIADARTALGPGEEQGRLQLAVFDYLVNNADRKAGHCLVDSQGALWGIDHGLTFHSQTKLRTVIWEFAGRRLPTWMRPDLEHLAGELQGGPAQGELEEVISPEELEALRLRLDTSLGPRFRLPSPHSDWSVPWPPI